VTAPYLSISVQLDTPDAPLVDGRPVHVVSWCAVRYGDGEPAGITLYAHHVTEPYVTVLVRTENLATADVPAWVPRPPSGWLASLKMTEPVRPASPLMAGGVW